MINKYAKVGEKFCEGVCDRKTINTPDGPMLVCDGCKRIVIDPFTLSKIEKKVNTNEQKYTNKLVGGTSSFNRQTDHLKIRDTSKDDFVFDGKKFVKSD